MSKQYDDTDTFILFVNDKGDNPKRPDRTGKINVGGTEYKLSGWIVTDEDGRPKKDKNGHPMLRGKVSPADDRTDRERAPQQAASPAALDDLPF